MIRNAKRDWNYKQIGINPSSKTIHRTLKYELANWQKIYSKTASQTLGISTRTSRLSGNFYYPKSQIMMTTQTQKILKTTMVLNYSDENEVARLLNRLRNKEGVGHDGSSKEMLKQCSPLIEKFLNEAFNNSITDYKIPDLLKLAKVLPIYDKGKKYPENYWPMSLLSSISKICEKLLYNCMLHVLGKNKLFPLEHLVFRKKVPAFMQLVLWMIK